MNRRNPALHIVAHIVLVAACLLALFPLFWVALTSIKRGVDANSRDPFSFVPTLENYVSLFRSDVFLHAMLTTAVTTAGSVVGAVIVGTMAAYGLARMRVLGRRLFVVLLVLLQIVPFVVLLIPLFQMVSLVGLYDTWFALIVVQIALFTPFVTWLMLAFIRSIPFEIEEAAFVDGATRVQLIRHILVPMLAPGMVAAAIFTGIAAWNSFILPIVLGQSNTFTLTAYAARFATAEGVQWPQMCAAAVIIIAPIIVFALIMQRRLVTGITAGSLKS